MFEIFATDTGAGGTVLGVLLVIWGIYLLCKKRKEAAEKAARDQAGGMRHVGRIRCRYE